LHCFPLCLFPALFRVLHHSILLSCPVLVRVSSLTSIFSIYSSSPHWIVPPLPQPCSVSSSPPRADVPSDSAFFRLLIPSLDLVSVSICSPFSSSSSHRAQRERAVELLEQGQVVLEFLLLRSCGLLGPSDDPGLFVVAVAVSFP